MLTAKIICCLLTAIWFDATIMPMTHCADQLACWWKSPEGGPAAGCAGCAAVAPGSTAARAAAAASCCCCCVERPAAKAGTRSTGRGLAAVGRCMSGSASPELSGCRGASSAQPTILDGHSTCLTCRNFCGPAVRGAEVCLKTRSDAAVPDACYAQRYSSVTSASCLNLQHHHMIMMVN